MTADDKLAMTIETFGSGIVCCLSYLFELFHVDESILVPVKNLKIELLSSDGFIQSFKKVFRNKSLLLEVINFMKRKCLEGIPKKF